MTSWMGDGESLGNCLVCMHCQDCKLCVTVTVFLDYRFYRKLITSRSRVGQKLIWINCMCACLYVVVCVGQCEYVYIASTSRLEKLLTSYDARAGLRFLGISNRRSLQLYQQHYH